MIKGSSIRRARARLGAGLIAPPCPQPPSGFGVASTSENCLYLNLFTPTGLAGCASQTAACLRARPVSAIVDNEDFAGYQPDVDGTVLTQSIGPALASGQFSRVPVINGTNRDEWRLFVAQAQLDGGPPVTAANCQAEIACTIGVSTATAAVIAARYPLSAYSSPLVARMSSTTRTRPNATWRRSASLTGRHTSRRSNTCSPCATRRSPACSALRSNPWPPP